MKPLHWFNESPALVFVVSGPRWHRVHCHDNANDADRDDDGDGIDDGRRRTEIKITDAQTNAAPLIVISTIITIIVTPAR